MTVRCVYDGFVVVGGVPTLVSQGDEYDDSHPLVQERPDLFTQPAPQQPAPHPDTPPAPEVRQTQKGKVSDG